MVLCIFKGGRKSRRFKSRQSRTFLKYLANRWAAIWERPDVVGRWLKQCSWLPGEASTLLVPRKLWREDPEDAVTPTMRSNPSCGEQESNMVEQDKRALSTSHGPSDAGTGAAAQPPPWPRGGFRGYRKLWTSRRCLWLGRKRWMLFLDGGWAEFSLPHFLVTGSRLP